MSSSERESHKYLAYSCHTYEFSRSGFVVETSFEDLLELLFGFAKASTSFREVGWTELRQNGAHGTVGRSQHRMNLVVINQQDHILRPLGVK